MNTCPCPACSGPSGLALLHGEILDVLHERVGRDRATVEIRPPIRRAGRQDHILALFANEHFIRTELELLRQPHGLAAIVHEHLGSSLHGLDSSRYLLYRGTLLSPATRSGRGAFAPYT